MTYIDPEGRDVWNNPRTWESASVADSLGESIDVAPDGSWSREVNKSTHEIGFDNETESRVTIVVKPRAQT